MHSARSPAGRAAHVAHMNGWRERREGGLVCVVSLCAPHERSTVTDPPSRPGAAQTLRSVALSFRSVFCLSVPPRRGGRPRRISSNDLSQWAAPAKRQVPPDLSRLKIKIPQSNLPFSIRRRSDGSRARRKDRGRDCSSGQQSMRAQHAPAVRSLVQSRGIPAP